jgi:competence protein ComEC
MLLRPEAVAGPSFQLSFAAIATIVALHGHPRVAALLARRDEGVAARIGRNLLGLILTGVAVEAALMPIALFHFHQSGLYGSLANLIAIPLTTVVVMPAEALALALDLIGMGAPLWWVVAQALDGMIAMSHAVASLPGSLLLLPDMPRAGFALCIGGTLLLCLIVGRSRWWGLLPWLLGIGWTIAVPPPDLLVTGDGQHLAVRGDDRRLYLLRARAGDYVRDQIGEAMGSEADAAPVATMAGARCSPDFCRLTLVRGGRQWRILASRSTYRVDWQTLVAACRWADIVVSDRRLPRACTPRWLNADGALLRRSGGLAIRLDAPKGRALTIHSVAEERLGKPWADPPTIAPPRQPWAPQRTMTEGTRMMKVTRMTEGTRPVPPPSLPAIGRESPVSP